MKTSLAHILLAASLAGCASLPPAHRELYNVTSLENTRVESQATVASQKLQVRIIVDQDTELSDDDALKAVAIAAKTYEDIGVTLESQVLQSQTTHPLGAKSIALHFKLKQGNYTGHAIVHRRTANIYVENWQKLFPYPMPCTTDMLKLLRTQGPDHAGLGRAVCHEIGHLCGLWHPHDFVNDPVQDTTNSMPNAMTYKLTWPLPTDKTGFCFSKFQQAQIHSTLSEGKVWTQLQASGTWQEYLRRIKIANRYKLPTNTTAHTERR